MRLGLKRKIILSILGAGALPLVLGMLLAYSQSTTQLERVIGGNFQALAGETARSIDLVLGGEIARRTRIAGNDAIVDALIERNQRYKGASPSEIKNLLAREGGRWKAGRALPETLATRPALDILRRFARTQGLDEQAPERSALRALFLTDAQGALVLSVGHPGPSYPVYRHTERSSWRQAFNEGQGRIFLGNVSFDDQLGSYVFALSLPVLDDEGRAVGVLHSVYDANAFFKPFIHPVRFGTTGHVMLIDSTGTVIICPILPTGVRVSDPSLVQSVIAETPGWVKAEGDGHGSQNPSIIGFAPLPETGRITTASTGLLWHSFAWQSSEEIFAPTRSLLLWIATAGLFAIGLLASLGAYAAHRIVTPIRRLQEGAARIGRGDMTETIAIQTGDEIELLAIEFNAMNQRLQSAFSGLEEEVAAKTAEVSYLKEYKEKILNSFPDTVIILRENRTVEYVNAAGFRVLELPQNLLGRDLFEVLPLDPPTRRRLGLDLAAEPDSWVPRRVQEPSANRDPLHPRADENSRAPREIRLHGRIYRYRVFRVGAGAQEAGRIGLALRDVTEEHLLQDQLIQADKLAGLGTLTAGIAHEINNPLFVVMGLAESIEVEHDPRATRQHAQDIVKHAKHMSSIIKNFSRYTTHGAAEDPMPVDINQKLGDALKMAKLADGTDYLDVQFEPQPVSQVVARPEEIQQIFLNIIVNAIQAMKGRGRLRLQTDMVEGWVRIRVQDTGPGIPKPFLSKIFDPFFTTKEPGKGTGLGLNIVYQIVTKYGGTINVMSEEGRGAEFTIHFPAMVPVV